MQDNGEEWRGPVTKVMFSDTREEKEIKNSNTARMLMQFGA